MPETIPYEPVPFTSERAAMIRAQHHVVALTALLEAKGLEKLEPEEGPVFVEASAVFDLDAFEEPTAATEGRWELVLAGLVAEGVGPLEVKAHRWPLEDGTEVCQLSARLRDDMTPDHVTRLLRWNLQAMELARLTLADGLANCDGLAAALDPDAAGPPAEVACRGGELLRAIRDLLDHKPEGGNLTHDASDAVAERLEHHAECLRTATEDLSDQDEATMHFVVACLDLMDRAGDLLGYLMPSSSADADERA